jgi:hypothetical protein
MKYAGLCNHKTRVISLAVEYVQAYTPEQLSQLVLHEIAHAMRGRVATDAHDEQWLKIARRIGYTGEAVLPLNYPAPKIVWDVVCTSTGLILQLPEQPHPTVCKLCNTPGCTPLTERRQLVSQDLHNIPTPPHFVAPFFRRLKSILTRG